MGRITTKLTISNLSEPNTTFECNALVDTGTVFLALPSAWKDCLGQLEHLGKVKVELGNQSTTTAEVWGSVKLQIDGCRAVRTEILFVDMQPEGGGYEPLLGYIPMEQAQLAVDMATHNLVPVKYVDPK